MIRRRPPEPGGQLPASGTRRGADQGPQPAVPYPLEGDPEHRIQPETPGHSPLGVPRSSELVDHVGTRGGRGRAGRRGGGVGQRRTPRIEKIPRGAPLRPHGGIA